MKNSSISSITSKIKYKIVLLGDQAVGKSSIIQRFIHDQFDQKSNPTVGIDFLAKNIVANGKNYRLQLWDTAGQQRFRSLIPSYLKNAICALIVYDIANKTSFQHISQWIQLFKDHKNPNSKCVIICNKIDLKSVQISYQQANAFCKQRGFHLFLLSAKSGQNVESTFLNIISIISGLQVHSNSFSMNPEMIVKEESEKNESEKNEKQVIEQQQEKQSNTPKQKQENNLKLKNKKLNKRESNCC